jgi:cytochrome P450
MVWMILGAVLLAAVLLAIVKTNVRPKDFPPGPLSLPLLGSVLFLDVRNLGKSFKRLGNRYGDIFSIFIGTKPAVVLNSYPIIKEAFSMPEFNGRPAAFSGTFFQKGTTGICTTEGKVWEGQRTFFHERMVDLVKGKGMEAFQDVILDEIHDLKMDLGKMVGDTVPISYRLNVSIINILWTIASGRRLHSQQQEFQCVYECIDKITQFMSKAAIMSFMPFLSKIVPERITKMEKGRYHRNRFVAISQKWIREHKEDYRGNRTGDFQDAYLARMEAGDKAFTEEGLCAILREMFVIGAETESVMLRWAIRILSVHKDVQRKVQDEIDDVVAGDKDVKWQDREKLPYLRATICEIQRFADITPSGIGHTTTRDVDFHGFHLPKGTYVMANFTSCHRDATYWQSPLDFLPAAHFLDDQGQFVDDKPGFMPYGAGLRKCPGADVADMETFLILSNLLKSFNLRAPHDDDNSMGTMYAVGTGIIRNPKPYKIILHARE